MTIRRIRGQVREQRPLLEHLEGRTLLSYVITAPLDVNAMVAGGKASVSGTPFDIGSYANLFDGKASTLYRSANIDPATVQVSFAMPQTLREFRGLFSHTWGDPAYRWMVETADSQADLDGKTGSYAQPVPWTGTPSDQYSTVTLADAVTARIVRFTAERLTGDNYVHIDEFVLVGETTIESLAIEPGKISVAQFGDTPLRAMATDADGVISDYTGKVSWSSGDESIAMVDSAGLLSGIAPGATQITATLGTLSATADVTVTPYPVQQVDLDVTYIERLPRYDYDAAKNKPAPGDIVTFKGHLRNWGNWTSDVDYRWEIDGAVVQSGVLRDLLPDEERILDLPWTWEDGDHTVKLVVDGRNNYDELSEVNNAVEDRTNGLAVGFWVEQSLYDNFHKYQRMLGIGSNSWEDWAQRQMARWNQYNIDAVYPATPNGVEDRVRVDKITVVPDGALPLHGGLAGNNPDSTDKTVDLMWGFPSSALDGTFYSDHTSVRDGNPFYFEPSLIHEMGHARYLIDNYGYDVANNAEVTQVQVYENGTPVAGSALMPFLAFNSVLYYNQYGGVMTGPWHGWSPFEAGALNRIAGRRAVSGNQNAPGNIGEFLNDLPQNNHVRFVDAQDQPIAGAEVKVYQAAPGPGWYGKIIDDTPELAFTTDSDGYVQMPRNPFSDGGIIHTYGRANGIAILRIQSGTKVWYRFMEVPAFNLEYWKGHTQDAYYTFKLPESTTPQAIGVYGFDEPIAPGSPASTSNQTDFGDVDVKSGILTRQFVIRNTGGKPLSLTGSRITIGGTNAADFTVLDSLPSKITPQTIATFRVRFDPQGAGLRTAVMTITSDDPSRPSYQVNLQGEGTEPMGGYGVLARGHVLQVTGTVGDDQFSLVQTPTQFTVVRNGLRWVYPISPPGSALFTTIEVSGGAGDDSLSIHSTAPLPLVFDGGEGNDVIYVNAGTLSLPGQVSENAAVEGRGAGAAIRFSAAAALKSLTLKDGAVASIAADSTQFVVLDALEIDERSVLNVGKGVLVVQDGDVAAVEGLVRSGRNTSPLWQGKGILTDKATADTGLAVGQIEGDVVVRYTWNGDLNLDGRVNADDYFYIDQGFLQKPTPPTYHDGDFNFDGKINADDYFMIDQAFLNQKGVVLSAPKAALAFSTKRVKVHAMRRGRAVRPARKNPRHRA